MRQLMAVDSLRRLKREQPSPVRAYFDYGTIVQRADSLVWNTVDLHIRRSQLKTLLSVRALRTPVSSRMPFTPRHIDGIICQR